MEDRDRGRLLEEYRECRLCPHECGVNRADGEVGRCGVSSELLVARAMLHEWEEPPISGTRGSGAVFFAGCPLHCVICQNDKISRGAGGRHISIGRLAEIFLELQTQGAHNINLVTPTHYAPSIIAALEHARKDGLNLPVVYNTSGYESLRTLRMLRGHVDIYLTDFKYLSSALAKDISHAPDYPKVAFRALEEMADQCMPYTLQRPPSPDEPAGSCDKLLLRGVVVRQLLLPGQLEDAKRVTKLVFRHFGNDVCYSLMSQYTPMPAAIGHEFLSRTVTEAEYAEFVNFALDLGVTRSFMQEGGAAQDSFIPDFSNQGV